MLIEAGIVFLILICTTLIVRTNQLKVRFFSFFFLSIFIYYLFVGNWVFLFIYSATLTFLFSRYVNNSKLSLLLSLIMSSLPLFFFKIRAFVVLSQGDQPWGYNKNGNEGMLISTIVSVYILQLISYQIDIYRDRKNIIKSSIIFYGVSSFFTNLFNGPLVSLSKLKKVLALKKTFDHEQALNGVVLIVLGVMKKKIVIEHLIPLFDDTFNLKSPTGLTFLAVCLSPVFVFLEYSSLIDIIRGISKLYNFEIKNIYQSPLSKNRFSKILVNYNLNLFVWIRSYIYRPLCSLSFSQIDIFFWELLIFLFVGFVFGDGIKYLFFSIIIFIFYKVDQLLFTLKKKNISKWSKSILGVIAWPFGLMGITILSLIILSPSIKISTIIFKSILFKNIEIFKYESFKYFNLEIIFTSIVALFFLLIESYRLELKKLYARFPLVIRWLIISMSCVVLMLFYSDKGLDFFFFRV